MQIVIEEIDNVYYADFILNPCDLEDLNRGIMITEELNFKHRKCYVGIRFQGEWDIEREIKRPEKGEKSDEGVEGWKATQRVKGRPRSKE